MARMNFPIAPRLQQTVFSAEQMNRPEKLRQQEESRRLSILAQKAQLHQATQAEDRRSRLGDIYSRMQAGDTTARRQLTLEFPKEAMAQARAEGVAGRQEEDVKQRRISNLRAERREDRLLEGQERTSTLDREDRERKRISGWVSSIYSSSYPQAQYETFVNKGIELGYDPELMKELQSRRFDDPEVQRILFGFYQRGPDRNKPITRAAANGKIRQNVIDGTYKPSDAMELWREGVEDSRLTPNARLEQENRRLANMDGIDTVDGLLKMVINNEVDLGFVGGAKKIGTEIFGVAGELFEALNLSGVAFSVTDLVPEGDDIFRHLEADALQFFNENYPEGEPINTLDAIEAKLVYSLAKSRKGGRRLNKDDVERAVNSVGLTKLLQSEAKTIEFLKKLRGEFDHEEEDATAALSRDDKALADQQRGWRVDNAKEAALPEADMTLQIKPGGVGKGLWHWVNSNGTGWILATDDQLTDDQRQQATGSVAPAPLTPAATSTPAAATPGVSQSLVYDLAADSLSPQEQIQ